MKVKIKTSDNKLLNYETAWACAFDFKCIEDLTFAPWEFKIVETWVVIQVPEGYTLQLAPRSSTYKKHGLIQVNWIGIIDQDYCGNGDTIKFPYLNITDKESFLEAGTRIGQGMFVKIEKPEFELVDSMEKEDRGWFWSTGVK